MNKYRNKLVYNADTGEIKDDRRHMSMLEDFLVTTKRGGRNRDNNSSRWSKLAEIEDIEYFKETVSFSKCA